MIQSMEPHSIIQTCRLLGSGIACMGLLACDSSVETSGSADTRDAASSIARHIPLEGEPNFREFGGFETADGKKVRTGKVYRSGKLSKLTDADVQELEQLGIKTVVNFLSPNEIAHDGADRLPDGVKHISIPIDPRTGLEGILEELIHARKTGDFSKIPPDVNPEIHRVLVGEAREQYAQLIRTVLDEDNLPLVFHCSHGVHRTGTAAAIMLSALGVPWDAVREDYLLSNECRKEQNDKRIGQLRDLAAEHSGVAPQEVDTANIRAFYVLDGSYIDASKETVKKDYGSFDQYLLEGLELTQEEVAALRELMLE